MDYDVIVIGGGHAGCEAAAAAARIGARTALVSGSIATVGTLSCNPSIGGLGKGHLVREIDACDGLMARAADAAAIHYRMLNRSKGPAVHGPRVQVDRKLYRLAIVEALQTLPGLDLIEADATALLLLERDRVRGVTLADGRTLTAAATVIATGTFLNGHLFQGHARVPGGRWGEEPATLLAAQLRDLGLVTGRLKTGTPPRLDGRTIDWAAVEEQSSDDEQWTMSALTEARTVPQLSCGVTRTNEEAHALIRAHLHESAVYSGEIEGRGPRYCPSIEDKVVRFPDRSSHQIFLEPEGLDDHVIYPNGISTSLDPATQLAFVRAIAGLHRAKIVRAGYAVEYDHVDPRCLDRELRVRQCRGLFLAGQINGTTGYEEAAAQGLAAGASAAAEALERDAMRFDRTTSYVGVMIDDLSLHGVTEPYRMLTARAEFRLRMRADNAATRLGDAAAGAGLLSARRWQAHAARQGRRQEASQLLSRIVGAPFGEASGVREHMAARPLHDWLRIDGIDWAAIMRIEPVLRDLPSDIADELIIDSRYAPYVVRQERDVARVAADETLLLAPDLDFAAVSSLSAEMVERLSRASPRTLGAAARVRGITPAAIAALLVHARRAA